MQRTRRWRRSAAGVPATGGGTQRLSGEMLGEGMSDDFGLRLDDPPGAGFARPAQPRGVEQIKKSVSLEDGAAEAHLIAVGGGDGRPVALRDLLEQHDLVFAGPLDLQAGRVSGVIRRPAFRDGVGRTAPFTPSRQAGSRSGCAGRSRRGAPARGRRSLRSAARPPASGGGRSPIPGPEPPGASSSR